ncbi:MAG: class I SAM-dependent rRNA methyltransferase [Bacteroidaceae bacterium]|nr:class I SAM-dependent rRNA methyltransferase [Bacteroidaceae bacterium]
MYKTVYLRKGKEESLGRFHPWVFSGAIHHIDGRPEEGDVVRVISADGRFLAVGHIQIGSIAVRVLSFEDITIDHSFWKERLSAAYDVRRSIFGAQLATNNSEFKIQNLKYTDAFRLVHGEGDGLPGLVIDVYNRTAVMQAHSVGIHVSRHEIADALAEVLDGVVDNIYYKSENTLAYKASEDGGNGFLKGSLATADDIATENGLRFHVDWLGGQKTGFFVDQRENRALLEHYSQGRKVLNMFCYTGGFSFYAMRGGAELVHSVDSSSRAIDITRANVELNFPGDARHEAFAEDAFKYLDRMGDQYDLIILDPPAFAKHKDALRNALMGYRKLNAKAFEKIRPGGILFTFSCSQVVTKDNFRTAVFTAAAMSGRRVRILHQLTQPADHPVSIYHPEGEYLKGLVLYVE